MLEQLRTKYSEQLKRDPAKEFGPEFVRTTNLERWLVDEYGFDGIRLIFDQGDNYYPLGAFPDDCPWIHVNALDRKAAIQQLFASLDDDLPKFIKTLLMRCEHIYVEQSTGKWFLHYFLGMTLYDGRPYFHVYRCGSSNPAPQANAILEKHQWSIPSDLARLYAVHDGLGPILGSEEIVVSAEIMEPICKEHDVAPQGYQFRDLLEFFTDGCGNAQCFFRGGERLITVDWDHETWELSAEQRFFEFVDRQLIRLDEE